MCCDISIVTLHNICGVLSIRGRPLHNQKCVFDKAPSLRIYQYILQIKYSNGFIFILSRLESIILLNHESNIFMGIIDKELWDSKGATHGRISCISPSESC